MALEKGARRVVVSGVRRMICPLCERVAGVHGAGPRNV